MYLENVDIINDLDYEIVLKAVKKTIINNFYPPTIHEVRKNAIELINPTQIPMTTAEIIIIFHVKFNSPNIFFI